MYYHAARLTEIMRAKTTRDSSHSLKHKNINKNNKIGVSRTLHCAFSRFKNSEPLSDKSSLLLIAIKLDYNYSFTENPITISLYRLALRSTKLFGFTFKGVNGYCFRTTIALIIAAWTNCL